MTCGKCKGHFCWVCKQVINDKNPYDHFKNRQVVSRWNLAKKSLNYLSVFPCKFKTEFGCKTFSNEPDEQGLQKKPLKLFLTNCFWVFGSGAWAF
jgi:hypothetical protein